MKFVAKRRYEEPEINFIPLIDVLMVILIFLMITTTYSKYTELQISLPTADSQQNTDKPNELVVSISKNGQMSLNKQPVVFRDVATLASDMQQAVGKDAAQSPTVVISADAEATHQSVVYVMEAARIANISKVTFATQHSSR
jgi:biopolymer transport protein ExbD